MSDSLPSSRFMFQAIQNPFIWDEISLETFTRDLTVHLDRMSTPVHLKLTQAECTSHTDTKCKAVTFLRSAMRDTATFWTLDALFGRVQDTYWHWL